MIGKPVEPPPLSPNTIEDPMRRDRVCKTMGGQLLAGHVASVVELLNDFAATLRVEILDQCRCCARTENSDIVRAAELSAKFTHVGVALCEIHCHEGR